MNWLDRARREIQERARRSTANTAEGNPVAVTAVPRRGFSEKSKASVGSSGSAPLSPMLGCNDLRAAFEERAAIIEFDGGLSRDEAERAAWALVLNRHRLH